MNRRKPVTPNLLAARVRSVRKPPPRFPTEGCAPRLRVSYGAELDIAGQSGTAVDHGALLADTRQAAAALRVASTAIAEVHDRLVRLRALLQPGRRMRRRSTDERTARPSSGGDRTPRRRSPDGQAAFQAEIDGAIEAIDRTVTTTQYDRRCLLDGQWSVAVTDIATGRRRQLRIRSLRPSDLGDPRFGYLASAAGATCPTDDRRISWDAVCTIIKQTAAQVQRQREQIQAFLGEVIGPCLCAAEIAAENTDAAEKAGRHPDFAVRSGELTRADVLLHALAADSPSHQDAMIASLAISHENGSAGGSPSLGLPPFSE